MYVCVAHAAFPCSFVCTCSINSFLYIIGHWTAFDTCTVEAGCSILSVLIIKSFKGCGLRMPLLPSDLATLSSQTGALTSYRASLPSTFIAEFLVLRLDPPQACLLIRTENVTQPTWQ
jgi:hypothetical protein